MWGWLRRLLGLDTAVKIEVPTAHHEEELVGRVVSVEPMAGGHYYRVALRIDAPRGRPLPVYMVLTYAPALGAHIPIAISRD